MQVWMHGWSSNSFSDHGHQFAIMKNTRIEFFLTWVLHLLMKRNPDSNWRFDLACGSVDLFVLPVIFIRALIALSTSLCINQSPVISCDILGAKFRVPNDLHELFEACLGFFFRHHSSTILLSKMTIGLGM